MIEKATQQKKYFAYDVVIKTLNMITNTQSFIPGVQTHVILLINR